MRKKAACLITSISLLMMSTVVIAAHDFWSNGQRVDPQTKVLCCGQSDCKHIEAYQVQKVPSGYLLHDTGEFIGQERAMPSPDGEYWVCRWGGETKCFFVPMTS